MRVVRVHELGGPEVLKVEEVPGREPGPGEVRVRLHAMGVNPAEVGLRSGMLRKPPLPWTPGRDGAGEVISVGAGVERVKAGMRVYVAGAPCYAEETVAPESAVWPLPDALSFEQGAAIGVPYFAAWNALYRTASLRPGNVVLVHGASGGVGTGLLQIGRAAGFRMVGTASTEQGRHHVLDQGAEAALPHDAVDDLIKASGGDGFDAVMELNATANLDADLRLIKAGGQIVVIGSRGPTNVNPGMIMGKLARIVGISGMLMTPEETLETHLALRGLLEAGVIRPVVSERIPLASAPEAHRRLERGGAVGQIVLVP